jgi:branched-chain amino acid transport system permease protein
MRQEFRRQLRNVTVAIALLTVAPLPVLGSTYYQSVLTHLVLIAVIAVALNIVFGQTDQLFLFMGGLAGLGAYGTALLADWSSLSAWATLLVTAIIVGLVGMAVSWISAKREFTVVLISILTLNLQLILVEVFVGAREITGGSTGFPYRYFSIEPMAESLGVSHGLLVYYVCIVLLLAALVAYVVLIESKYGVAFAAIREDNLAAASIGVDVVYYKSIAGFISAFFIAIAGAFMAREAGFLLPNAYTFLAVDVAVLIALIVGGLRTTLGPVVGAAIVVSIEQYLRANATDWRTAIFGALLLILFLYFRRGIITEVTETIERHRDEAESDDSAVGRDQRDGAT